MNADGFFDALKSYWTPLPPGILESFLGHTKEFMELEVRLRNDQSLVEYDREMYPELATLLGLSWEERESGAAEGAKSRAGLHMCTQQLQIMERIFLAVKLDRYHAHAMNRGWMNLFRRWSGNPTMGRLWPSLKSNYSKDFVAFADYQLNFTSMDIIPLRQPAQPFQLAELFALRSSKQAAAFDSPLSALQRLFSELGQEWPLTTTGWSTSLYFDPFHTSTEMWTISHPHAVREDIWGIALIAPNTGAQLDADLRLERLMVWIRPAYRGVGLGRNLFRSILDGMDISRRERLLIVLPPLERDKPGYREEMAGWLHFYEREGFVRTVLADAKKLVEEDAGKASTPDTRFHPDAFCLVMPGLIRALHMRDKQNTVVRSQSIVRAGPEPPGLAETQT